MKLGIKRLSESATLPKYQSKQASGFDLHSVDNYVLKPGETHLISTGLAFDIPEGYEIQIRPRSGLSAKTGLRVANAPGTVDADYTGEVKIIMANTGNLIEIIDKGDRIAQAVLAPVVQAEIVEVEEINQTERGSAGFGSTGV